LAAFALLALALMLFSAYQVWNARASEGEFYGTALAEPVQVGELELTSHRGERVALSDFRGKLTLVFFGFTNCPDVCPLTLGRLAKLYRDLGEPDDVQVVMVTVDPEHDTPEVLGRYLGQFHEAFVGLTGTPAEIANAARTFFVGYRDLGERDFLHTDSVALLDRQGRMRLVYGQDRVVRLESDLPKILGQRGW
jgi:protein SCO1/2